MVQDVDEPRSSIFPAPADESENEVEMIGSRDDSFHHGEPGAEERHATRDLPVKKMPRASQALLLHSLELELRSCGERDRSPDIFPRERQTVGEPVTLPHVGIRNVRPVSQLLHERRNERLEESFRTFLLVSLDCILRDENVERGFVHPAE